MYYVLYILSRGAEAGQHGAESEFLREGPENPSCDTMKEMPRLQSWRTQGHLLRTATYRE